MAYGEQSLGNFLNARLQASELLVESGVRKRPIPYEEALVLQAISHLLGEEPVFFGQEIMRLADIEAGVVYPILHTFEDKYGLLQISNDARRLMGRNRGRPRRYYEPTAIGSTVIELFNSSSG